VRHRILVASATAILLLGTAAIVVLERGAPEPIPMQPQTGPLSPGSRDVARREPADANALPQPSRPPAPSFDIVKVGPTGTAVIAGRAEPGSRVTVRDGDQVIGEVTADNRGEWVLIPERPLAAGDRLLSLEAASRRGGAPVKSEETVALSITPTAPGGTSNTALAVVLPRDGIGPARVLQRPEPASPTASVPDKGAVLSMDAVEYDDQGRLLLSGRARPGARVQIYIGNEPVGTATANAAGGWSAVATRAATSRHTELRLDQLAEDGHVVQRLTLPLARATPAQLAAGQSYIVQSGNSLWQIARRTYGNGVRYVIIYAANMGQIRDPERIYPGQIFKLPKS
jgi:nucleoid-associated protein YgaU